MMPCWHESSMPLSFLPPVSKSQMQDPMQDRRKLIAMTEWCHHMMNMTQTSQEQVIMNKIKNKPWTCQEQAMMKKQMSWTCDKLVIVNKIRRSTCQEQVIMNKSRTSHEHVMKKSGKRHEQVIISHWTIREQVINQSWILNWNNHEQVMDVLHEQVTSKSWTSYQLINQSWTNHESNKSWACHDQIHELSYPMGKSITEQGTRRNMRWFDNQGRNHEQVTSHCSSWGNSSHSRC